MGSSCNWRENRIYKCLPVVSFVSIMTLYFFMNTSFYVASILSETQLTVFNVKGCMEKVPKVILTLYLLHKQT